MERIPEDVMERARQVNLIDFCRSQGIEMRKEGQQYVLEQFDSLYIKISEPYKWYRHSTRQGGKAVDFCVYFLGMNVKEAVEALLNTPVIEISPTGRKKERSSEQHSVDFSDDTKRVIAYLCQRRKIDYERILKPLLRSEKLGQDKRGNCVFRIFDFDGIEVGAELHGTSDKRFKGFVGQQDCFGFSVLTGSITNVVYFESAIDLLSFQQIKQPKSSLLVSMGGLKPLLIQKHIEQYPTARHFIAVDNDDRGNEFKANCIQQFGVSSVSVPTGKDWNEYLISQKEG